MLFNKKSLRSRIALTVRTMGVVFALSAVASIAQAQIAFDQKSLDFNGNGSIAAGTSLQFGPDGLLYVSQVNGVVKVFTIVRNETTDEYEVTDEETILDVQNIPNHNDDGTDAPGTNTRQVTGLVVGGSAGNVELYVTSSDSRIGAGGSGSDVNLDTNSGVITRLTRNGSGWDAVDIVRGLPRSEENHATNGLELVQVAGRDDNNDSIDDRFLIVASGGLTNAGSPSNNFAFISEYALSAAILAVNLDVLEDLMVQTDASSGRSYIYDLPTLDDPTRANANGVTDPDDPTYDGIDVGDPWGGNDGLNMSMVVPDGPVQLFSPGYRNSYDLEVTENGKVYVTDNGANGGWGGYPEFEATANVTNNFRAGEPGSSSTDVANGNEPAVNNQDHLNLVTTDINSYDFGSVYGGHPSPVRANVNAGLYTNGVFRTTPFDPDGSNGGDTNPNTALPANWPPVPAPDPSITRTSDFINVANADYRQPNDHNPDSSIPPPFVPGTDPLDDITVTSWQNNTNGITEYRASNFGGRLQGALIAGKNGGTMHIVTVDPTTGLLLPDDPATTDLTEGLDQNFFSGLGGNALGVTAQGDSDLFPGTIWVATFNSNIVILEPNDFVLCVLPGDPGYDPNADNDFDGYTNQDEEDNGTDLCSGASQPNDFDDDNISDLNDPNDDNDALNDDVDPSQLGSPLNLNVNNELFSDQLDSGGNLLGYLGLGLTGLMNNGDANPNWLNWIDRTDQGTGPNDILGGAIGAVTIQQTGGTAAGAANTQEKGFQYTVDVSTATGAFTVSSIMSGLNEAGQLYAFTVDPGDGQPSQGIQIGTGFQDNYIELILTQAGITLREEVNDVEVEIFSVAIDPGDRPQGSAGEVELFFNINPTLGTVQGQYSVDSGPVTSVGTVTAEGATLAALQTGAELAVGLIGTSGAPETSDPNDDKEFAATWQNLITTGSSPAISAPLPDLDRVVDDPNDTVDLNDFFEDNNGTANLTYTVESNSNPAVGASISANELTLTYPSAPAMSTITIRATDADALFVEQSFVVTVAEASAVVIRINAGGALVAADDGGPDWVANTSTAGAGYTVTASNVATFNLLNENRDASVPANISETVFNQLFAQERWDAAGGPEMLWDIPLPNATYEVRLYMGNGFGGTSAPGQRVFDVNIEGGALEIDDLDLSATYGHQVGAMESYVVNVSDGALNIEFLHDVIENPLVNAIEVLTAPSASLPISIESIPNQISFEGLDVTVPVSATGGDGALSYAATGLPSGVSIDSGTGVISGIIGAGAAAGSPYSVEVTVDDNDGDTVDAQTVAFTWDIGLAPDPGDILFRINAGGPLLSDPNGDWSEDQNATDGTPSPYLNMSPGSNDTTFTAPFTGINTTGAPDALFSTERFSSVGGTVDNMQYDIPVTSGDYIVNLYFAEIFSGAQDPGVRVFDVQIEGQLAIDNLDQALMYGPNNAGIVSIPVTVSDDNLDIDFIQGVQNPAIKGIEVLNALPPANPDAAALFSVDTGGLGSSSFDGGFSITNNSVNGLQIVSLSMNLSTAILPEIVFDPNGTAGDPTTKCFEAESGAAEVGLITDGSGSGTASCIDPFSAPRGNGGFDIITIDFNDFDPGESFEFAVDVDPTSINADSDAGKISGLEMTGSTITVGFSDGSTQLVGETYRVQPDSLGGSQNAFLPDPLSASPLLNIPGAVLQSTAEPGAQNAIVGTLSPTAQIAGPAGSAVTLLVLQVDKSIGVTEPFEANMAVAASEIDAVIGGSGTVSVPLTLTDGGPDDLNYIAAVIVQPDGRTTDLSTIWRVDYDPSTSATPEAMVQVNPGAALDASTFGTGSFVIMNTGTDTITSLSINTTTGYLPDVVFDPNGTAGDAGAKCLVADSGGTETGYVAPADNCADPFSMFHNGVDSDDGYDQVNLSFTDFDPGETFTFSVDMDPTSIKNDTTSGDAGSISGFELIGSTVTITFGTSGTISSSLFDEGSLGGSMAIVEAGGAPTPTLALVGNPTPIALPDTAQSVLVSGTPGANVWLLQVDARLYIDAGGGGFDIDPFEANDAMAKVIGNLTIDPDGDNEVAVTLASTTSTDAGPDGGLNHFIAIEDSATGAKGLTSNVLVVELDPTVVIDGTLNGTMTLQGRTENSGDVTVTLYDLSGVQVGAPQVVTANAAGEFTATGITPGTYQVAVKAPSNLQVVDVVDIVAGSTAFDFDEAPTGDADNSNAVNILDFSTMVATFGLVDGDPGFNANADFDGSGQINILDFSLLVSTFGDIGETPSGP